METLEEIRMSAFKMKFLRLRVARRTIKPKKMVGGVRNFSIPSTKIKERKRQRIINM